MNSGLDIWSQSWHVLLSIIIYICQSGIQQLSQYNQTTIINSFQPLNHIFNIDQFRFHLLSYQFSFVFPIST